MKVTFKERELSIDGTRHRMTHPIDDAVVVGDLIVVLYNQDSVQVPYGQFQNLVAIGQPGHIVWEAELPTNNTGDCYYRIASTDPLVAYSIYSFDCMIDVATGKILSKTFTK